MNSLDAQFEQLITERNNFEKENLKLRELVKSLKRTIEDLKNDKARNKRVSGEY